METVLTKRRLSLFLGGIGSKLLFLNEFIQEKIHQYGQTHTPQHTIPRFPVLVLYPYHGKLEYSTIPKIIFRFLNQNSYRVPCHPKQKVKLFHSIDRFSGPTSPSREKQLPTSSYCRALSRFRLQIRRLHEKCHSSSRQRNHQPKSPRYLRRFPLENPTQIMGTNAGRPSPIHRNRRNRYPHGFQRRNYSSFDQLQCHHQNLS